MTQAATINQLKQAVTRGIADAFPPVIQGVGMDAEFLRLASHPCGETAEVGVIFGAWLARGCVGAVAGAVAGASLVEVLQALRSVAPHRTGKRVERRRDVQRAAGTCGAGKRRVAGEPGKVGCYLLSER